MAIEPSVFPWIVPAQLPVLVAMQVGQELVWLPFDNTETTIGNVPCKTVEDPPPPPVPHPVEPTKPVPSVVRHGAFVTPVIRRFWTTVDVGAASAVPMIKKPTAAARTIEVMMRCFILFEDGYDKALACCES